MTIVINSILLLDSIRYILTFDGLLRPARLFLHLLGKLGEVIPSTNVRICCRSCRVQLLLLLLRLMLKMSSCSSYLILFLSTWSKKRLLDLLVLARSHHSIGRLLSVAFSILLQGCWSSSFCSRCLLLLNLLHLLLLLLLLYAKALLSKV